MIFLSLILDLVLVEPALDVHEHLRVPAAVAEFSRPAEPGMQVVR
jgi:hypothetical protein